jgi:hypothetical protein
MDVETKHPIPNHLKSNTADPCRIPSRAPVVTTLRPASALKSSAE